MKSDLPSRIKLLIEAAGSVRSLARFLDVSRMTVTAWLSGGVPYESTMMAITEKTGVSMQWLRYGEGDDKQQVEKFRQKFSDFVSGPRSRLKRAREKAGLTVAEVARRTGSPIARLQELENGRAGLTEDLARKLVAVLPEIELDELMGGSDTPRVIEETGRYGTYGAQAAVTMPGHAVRLVPLLSMAQAGTLDNGWDDASYDYTGVISIDIKDPKAFGVEIRGNSMEPRIMPGDNAIVCPGWTPRTGDTVICRTMDGDVMCKLYQPRNGGELVILSSYNAAYPPVELKRDEISWIYPVGQVVQNLRRE